MSIDSKTGAPRGRGLGFWAGLTLVVMAFGFRAALHAPVEATMGNLYRVFFYHFPHTILSFVFPYLNCAGSLLFLYWRTRKPVSAAKADAFAVASAEATVVYATVGLATGMLWGRAAWGIWWTWDARLTTYLLLWLLYVSYILLRRMSASSQTRTMAAVLSVFAALDVPICYESIRWWRTQHPSPVFGGGADSGIDPSMYAAVWWNLIAWAMWGGLIVSMRYTLERRRQLQMQREALLLLQDAAPASYEPLDAGLPGDRGLLGEGGRA